jgi:thioredoxin-like negative regulator of GroEL
MLERLVVLVAIASLVALGTLSIRAWSRGRVAGVRQSAAGLWPALGESPDGRPALVVFSTPACVACRTAQEPAVQAVRGRFGEALRVLHVDIGQRPGAARAFRILTAPSTVVLNADGQVQSVNQGFASADHLVAQLSAAIA